MESYTTAEQSHKIQNGDTRNDPDLPTDRRVGDAHRLQGCLLP